MTELLGESPDTSGQETLIGDLEQTEVTGEDGQVIETPDTSGQVETPQPAAPGTFATMTPEQQQRAYENAQAELTRRSQELASLKQQQQPAPPPAVDPQAVEDQRLVEAGTPYYALRKAQWAQGEWTDEECTAKASEETKAIYAMAKTVARQILADELGPIRGLMQAEVLPNVVSREITGIVGDGVSPADVINALAESWGLPAAQITAELAQLAPQARKAQIKLAGLAVRGKVAAVNATKTPPQRVPGTLGTGGGARTNTPTPPGNIAIRNEYKAMFPNLTDEQLTARHGHAIAKGIHP